MRNRLYQRTHNEPDTLSSPEHVYPEAFWHSLFLFNISRMIITCGLMILAWSFHFVNLGSHDHTLFSYAAWLHLLVSSLLMVLIRLRKPDLKWQLMQQVCTDVIFICIMIYASGGLESGLGILLMISLAGAGLISKGRMALFFAAIATIGVLLEEIYAFLYMGSHAAQFTHAALLSMGYFAVAWVAQRLAKHAVANEKLAHERGIDLANMAQINQLIIKDLQEGILVVDNNGKIRQCNTYAEKLIGLKSQPEYFKPPILSEYAPALASRLSSWRSNTDISFDLLRLSKNNTLVRTRFIPIENNSHASIVIYLEDTSRIQSQIQQLKLAALGRLTANIAHEIRNPLSSISHAAELLEEDAQFSGTGSNHRLLRIINDNTQRLNKIVQDVLQLNRRDTVQVESIDAIDFIDCFIDDFCLIEKIDKTVFQLDFTNIGTTGLINFDPNHLRQILWNLCCNAWRHCRRQKGSIIIKITRCTSTNRMLLDIRDDGAGVPAIQLKQLFEPFFTTAANGTGLGLYIARELCEANHAALEYICNTGCGHFRVFCKDANHHA
ncbi:two-component system sensor histidine kinase NtrB [Nitrosomonas aestuarii]|uniref:two-component system sensor histidine kinase NtrB n=1 Tax=Nitrosomonas aestuarii TaxID=52441 RepID=UPI0011B25AA6|nr:ATP-binding protein [Nitrosomonas aestuarii]